MRIVNLTSQPGRGPRGPQGHGKVNPSPTSGKHPNLNKVLPSLFSFGRGTFINFLKLYRPVKSEGQKGHFKLSYEAAVLLG